MDNRPLEIKYGEAFYRKRKYLAWRAKPIGIAIENVLQPKSIIDVGCSVGEFVKYFEDKDIYAQGIESNIQVYKHAYTKNILIYDLRQVQYAFTSMQRFDVALCFEVISIIGDAYLFELAINLSNLSDKLLLTVHKEQEDRWNECMYRLKYGRDYSPEEQVRMRIEYLKDKKAVRAIYNTLHCYVRMN